MRITIPDDLADAYQSQARPGQTLDEVCAERLLRAIALVPNRRALLLDAPVLELLEERLGGGHLKEGADLVKRLDRWCQITIGQVRLPFTVAQLEELQHRAEKQGKLPKQLIEETVKGMYEQFFHVVGI